MLNHADTFNSYGTNAGLLTQGIYTYNYGAVIVADPVVPGNNVLGFNHVGGIPSIRYPVPRSTPTQGIAFRVIMDNLVGGDGAPVIGWQDNNGNIVAYVTTDATGRLVFVNNGQGGGGQSTVSPVVTAGSWWHVEIEYVSSTTGAGTFNMQVEGEPVMSITGLNTGWYDGGGAYHPVAEVGIAFLGKQVTLGESNPRYKDVVFWDGTGTDNNTFLGNCLCIDLETVADVTLGGWTSTGANGWSVLSNNPPNDAEYIDAHWNGTTLPSECQFSFSSLPVDASSVQGAVLRYRGIKTDGGDGMLQSGLISNATETHAAARPMTVSENFYTDVYEVDPHTSAPFTPGALNAVHASLNRTL